MLVDQEADGVLVLAMDHHRGAMRPGDVEGSQDLAIRQAQVLVGHEDLERGIAVIDQRGQILTKKLLGRVGHDQVETDICVAFAFGLGVVFLERFAYGRALFLKAEWQHGGIAAEQG